MAFDINLWRKENFSKSDIIKKASNLNDSFNRSYNDPKSTFNSKIGGVRGVGLGGVALEMGYVLYENWDETKDFWLKAFGVTNQSVFHVPKTNNKTAFPQLPAYEPVASKNLNAIKENSKTFSAAIEKLSKAQNDNVKIQNTINESLLKSYENAPLLQNHVFTKEALFEVSNRLLELSQTVATSLQVQDAHYLNFSTALTSIANSLITKVNDNRVVEASRDYGDGDFFYSFIPTSQYWKDVDLADFALQTELLGSVPVAYVAPSFLNAPAEIELIDSMQGVNTKKQIRIAIEQFRKSKVSAEVRAKIGVSLVEAEKSQTEVNEKAKEYYSKSIEKIQNGEEVVALNNIASAVAPIADWSIKAKEREVFLTTTISEVKDIDGNKVFENVRPIDISFAKDVAIAREKTDIINEVFDDLDLPSMEDVTDLIGLIPFNGISKIFDKNVDISTNPFLARYL